MSPFLLPASLLQAAAPPRSGGVPAVVAPAAVPTFDFAGTLAAGDQFQVQVIQLAAARGVRPAGLGRLHRQFTALPRHDATSARGFAGRRVADSAPVNPA